MWSDEAQPLSPCEANHSQLDRGRGWCLRGEVTCAESRALGLVTHRTAHSTSRWALELPLGEKQCWAPGWHGSVTQTHPTRPWTTRQLTCTAESAANTIYKEMGTLDVPPWPPGCCAKLLGKIVGVRACVCVCTGIGDCHSAGVGVHSQEGHPLKPGQPNRDEGSPRTRHLPRSCSPLAYGPRSPNGAIPLPSLWPWVT